MGFGRRNDEPNPPVPLQDHGQGAFQIREGGGVDGGQVYPAAPNGSTVQFMPTPNACPAISSYQSMHGMYQSYPYDPSIRSNSMIGVTGPNYLQSPQFDPSFVAVRGGLRKLDGCLSGLQSSQINRNVVPNQGSSAGGYQRKGEAEASTANWPSQITPSSSNLGCGASIPNQDADIVLVGVKNDINSSDIDAGKVDGSFLTLGRGSNTEGKTQGGFHPREVARNLGEAVGSRSSNSYIRPATNVYHNSTNDLSSFNSNSESRTKRKFDSREVSRRLGEAPVLRAYPVDDGVMQAATVDPYFGRQLPGPFKQRHIIENGCDSTDVLDNSIGKDYLQQFYTYPQGGPPPSTLRLDNTYSGLPPSGYTRPPDLASESSQHAWIANPPTRDLLGISDPGDVTSSLVCNSSSARGSYVTRDYLGVSTCPSKGNAMQAAGSGPQSTGRFPSTLGANSVHAFGSAGIPITQSSPNVPAMGAPFPRRLGVQLNDTSAGAPAAIQSYNQSLLSMSMASQTNSVSRYPSRDPRASQAANFVPAPVSGHYQARLPTQSSLQMPSFMTGTGLVQQAPSPVLVPQSPSPVPVPQVPSQAPVPQAPGRIPVPQAPGRIPVILPRGMHSPGQMYSNFRPGGPSQVYGRGDYQSLKRKANESARVLSWGQKKRFIPVPPHSVMGIPIDPSTPAHIKWTGSDNPSRSEPSGYKCLLCKRDLSFAPEGLDSQSVNPLAVAVLPCGHTFHEHCLEIITPDDQARDPPCIPCAIGEK
ncbi:OLC1v1014526C1 [Oldenlandia corymbosa var. corymbosa]|uniref:OLC1v1014526C1 n=1 Tax=Oldenlandia corymbosa var. corymbosa TaxID=529605 RepID=A0AAV1E0W5_OLDCO|nr:OLC1v1014526C1 [Oldenlandia corymbosa var. corymbosa]